MIGKVLLNIAYNIAIFVLLLSVVWSINNKRFELVAGAAFCLVILVFLKIRLVKQVRELTKRGQPK